MDLRKILGWHRSFSNLTFGPGPRTEALTQHIISELQELADAPEGERLAEWVDVILLGFDGALRSSQSPDPEAEVVQALLQKIHTNIERDWPDWREVPEGSPIEHVRDAGTEG